MSEPTIGAFIIGAQKAGTTSLFRYLAAQPGVVAHVQAEMPAFFEAGGRAVSVRRLRDFFPAGSYAEDSMLLAKHVFLMRSPGGLQSLFEHNPGCKVICVVREPVSRAYSAYHYAVRRGWNRYPDFATAISELMSHPDDEHSIQDVDLQNDHVRNGCYARDLKHVLSVFPRAQLKVVFSRDLAENPQSVARELLEWIGRPCKQLTDVGVVHNERMEAKSVMVSRLIHRLQSSRLKRPLRFLISSRRAYQVKKFLMRLNERPSQGSQMPRDVEAKLHEFYMPENVELMRLLGLDRTGW